MIAPNFPAFAEKSTTAAPRDSKAASTSAPLLPVRAAMKNFLLGAMFTMLPAEAVTYILSILTLYGSDQLTVASGLTLPSSSIAATPTIASKALPVSIAKDPASPVKVILDLRSGLPLMPATVKADPEAGIVPSAASLAELNSTFADGESFSSAVPHPFLCQYLSVSSSYRALTGVVGVVHAKTPGLISRQSSRLKDIAVDWTVGRAASYFWSFTEESIILELLAF